MKKKLILKILFAEDNKVQRQLFNGLISHYQRESDGDTEFNMTNVEDGEKAVVEALKNDYDLIFLDIEMPNKTGLQALEEIIKEKAEAYVVMITSHGTDDNVKTSLGMGAKGFVIKPYRINIIEQTIAQFLKHKKEKLKE